MTFISPRTLSTLFLLIPLGLAVPAAMAQQIVVDRLTTAQGPHTVDAGTPIQSSVAATAGDDILGGERDLFFTFGTGTDAQAEIGTHTGFDGLNLSTTAGSSATLNLTWDGADGDPLALDVTGLGGVDVTSGGTNEVIAIDMRSGGTATAAVFEVYTDATHCSIATLALSDPIDPPGETLTISFEGAQNLFTTCGGAAGPADFNSVGALVLTLSLATSETRPLQVEAGSITFEPSAPLAVELDAFAATADGLDAVLRWTTTSETNNAGFQVQAAAYDAHAGAFAAWQAHAFVPGHGTTVARQSYNHRLAGLAPGPYRFRLRQVDYDGTARFSPVVELQVDLPERFALSTPYPNPFNPTARFTLMVDRAQPVRVAAYDMWGRQVALLYDGLLPAQTAVPFTFSADDLPSGLYLIRATGAAFAAARRVMLVK